ncbi:MAG TPA: TRAP transporter TatT component family protein [Spirochaetia bacterium]|nr:TRAP transporter TatT component family protein [Spirochaetia bacterium]
MHREKVACAHVFSAGFVLLFVLCSCSINQLAVRAVAGVLSGSGESNVFTTDEDTQLVGDALPFALKTYEALLEADPQNAELALGTARAFAGYAYGFVQIPADELSIDQVDTQLAMHKRAQKLFLRARDYALRGLEIRRKGFRATLSTKGPAAALKLARPEDIDFLYWAGASWLGAFSAEPFDFSLIVTLPQAIALLQQVETWSDSYERGAVHEIFISYYAAAPAELCGSEEKARAEFARAVELSGGHSAGPYVALASSLSVKNQNLGEFRDLLTTALAVDVNAVPSERLTNTINQQKAQWMLDHTDRFFLEGQDTQ